MIVRATLLAALGLFAGLPLAAAAQAAPTATGDAVTAAASAYFGALNDANQTALARTVTPGFHIVETDGSTVSAADFLGAIYSKRLDSSGPRQSLKIDVPTISGTTATTAVYANSFDYRIFDGYGWLERDISEHKLALAQVDGKWLVSEDRITSAHHYE